MKLIKIMLCRNGAVCGYHRRDDGRHACRFISKQIIEKSKSLFHKVKTAVGRWLSLEEDQDTKTCESCLKPKSRSNYYQNRLTADGLHDRCKDCCFVREKPKPPTMRHYADKMRGAFA